MIDKNFHDNKSRYQFQASYTVEAAHIVPSILLIFIFVMWYGFYLHDQIIMDSWVAYNSEEGRMAVQYFRKPYSNTTLQLDMDDDDNLEEVEDTIAENKWNINNFLMAGKGYSMNSTVTGSSAEADVKYTRIKFLFYNYNEALKSRTADARRDIYDPSDIARMTSTVYRLYKKAVNKS